MISYLFCSTKLHSQNYYKLNQQPIPCLHNPQKLFLITRTCCSLSSNISLQKHTNIHTSMKSMAKRKMAGFTCHSPAATAVCMTPDSRSAIVPGRRSSSSSAAERNTTAKTDGERLLLNSSTVKYSKLVDSHNHHRNNLHRPHSQAKFLSPNVISCAKNDIDKTVVLPNPMITRDQTLRSVLSTTDRRQIGSLHLQQPLSVFGSVTDHVFQVVVMRVSLHCQGCAGKLKKHISKMEGVTSFSIELESKRVTVMGHVSPSGVLESISKIRRAEFWPSSFPAYQPQQSNY